MLNYGPIKIYIYIDIKSCYMNMQIWASIKRYHLFEFDYVPMVDDFTRTNVISI